MVRLFLILAAGVARRLGFTWLHRVFTLPVDSSPTLISLCRARMPDQEWIVGDMRLLSLGRRFDGILAWDSFFHLRHKDQETMFLIFAAHAAPAATLMFNAGFG